MTRTAYRAALAFTAVLIAGPIAAQAAVGVPDSLKCEDAFYPGDDWGHEICFWSDPLDNVDAPAEPDRAFESLKQGGRPSGPSLILRIAPPPPPPPPAPTKLGF